MVYVPFRLPNHLQPLIHAFDSLVSAPLMIFGAIPLFLLLKPMSTTKQRKDLFSSPHHGNITMSHHGVLDHHMIEKLLHIVLL
ncbi:hypothetical protein RJT34_12591 [Clitoria ternatea]|uniref:Uncharacterized protein n=1 Tax=Clitoria ternatea TaxID=43366 RepID=A0AAN9JQL3_CLITE